MTINLTTGQAIRFILDNYPKANKAKLARALGVTYKSVHKWETDRAKMSASVYLIFKTIFPHLEISDIVQGVDFELEGGDLPKQALTTQRAIEYVVAKDPIATRARLARALGVTSKTLSNYATGKSRMRQDIFVEFHKLYPTIEVTDVFLAGVRYDNN